MILPRISSKSTCSSRMVYYIKARRNSSRSSCNWSSIDHGKMIPDHLRKDIVGGKATIQGNDRKRKWNLH
jgi:hypothetical protein